MKNNYQPVTLKNVYGEVRDGWSLTLPDPRFAGAEYDGETIVIATTTKRKTYQLMRRALQPLER